jgi:hypothetical protein
VVLRELWQNMASIDIGRCDLGDCVHEQAIFRKIEAIDLGMVCRIRLAESPIPSTIGRMDSMTATRR